ncbi:MAG TPA: xanthine dehydrogenase family protein molybdopterin-binding subunit [Acidimicrobiales bacterium]
MSILGNRVVRTEDPRLLTVGGTYVSDVPLDGAAHVTYVRSPMAHARITGIDVSDAREAPGVLAVVTGADLQLPPYPLDFPFLPATMPRPFLATDVVRYVGEPIVAIVTEERAQGADAADLVLVDYEPLPVVVDPDAALSGEVLLFPETGTNESAAIPDDGTQIDWSECEVVVRETLTNQRVAPSPLEVRATAARWDGDGRLTYWAASQGAHPLRDLLANVYGLEPAQVRVVVPDVGGGFGAKLHSPEELLCPWLARLVGRPVRWVETRSESMLGIPHGRAQRQDIEIGGRRDGRVLAYRLTILQDSGAYPRIATFLPNLTRMMLTGTYDIPQAQCISRSVLTNTVPTGAYRGAGRPEAAFAIERAMDLFAQEIGMDPAEVRRRNVVAPEAFPFTTRTGTVYDSGRYAHGLDLVLAHADYDALRAEQRRRREAGERRLLGLGLAVYVEVTSLEGGTEYARVTMLDDGRVRVVSGSAPQGQGHDTTWAMVVADRLGVAIDAVEVVHGDTDLVPSGGITGGSRTAQISGNNIWQAAGAVAERGRELAARLLEADVADIVLDTEAGRFHVAGTPAVGRTWADVVALAAADGEELSGEGDFTQHGGTFPSGCHLAVVEIDRETGKVELVRFVAADDAGRILNPLIAEGQVHGGVAQGAAQALMEEVVFDEDGNPLTANFADYAFISAPELPSFETIHVETPSPRNELGVKGIGESGSIGSTPAVHNAVVDALSHLGVRHLPMPATPERVWRAINAATSARN